MGNRTLIRIILSVVICFSLIFSFPAEAGIKTKVAVVAGGLLAKKVIKRAIQKSTAKKAASQVGQPPVKKVFVSETKYPESARHIKDAQNAGAPKELTVSRPAASARRRESLKDEPIVKGKDRDEYPPAMMQEGGRGSSVRPIKPSDNRGAGSCIGAQCRNVPDGGKVRIEVVK